MRHFFSGTIKSIEMEDLLLPDSYYKLEFDESSISCFYIGLWVAFTGRVWDVRKGSHLYFIMQGHELVGAGYVLVREKIGTVHSFKVLPEHRRKNFYKLMALWSLDYMKRNGAETLQIETGQKILWSFWNRVGLKRVDSIEPFAMSLR